MSGVEGALLGSLTASVTGLLALAISRFRIRCVPDEDGNTRCLSACSEHGLVDADELHVEQYTIGDKQVLMLSSKSKPYKERYAPTLSQGEQIRESLGADAP